VEVKNFAALPESPGSEWLTWSSEPQGDFAGVPLGRNYGRLRLSSGEAYDQA